MTDTVSAPAPKKRTRMARPTAATLASAATPTGTAEDPAVPAAPPTEGPPAPAARVTKGAIMTALLSRPDGASIAELVEATGWQSHSVRGYMAGTLRKKPDITLTSDKTGTERIYRLVAGTGAA